MKKLGTLFLSALALGITVMSCSKDDSSKAASIEGKWTFSTMQALDSANQPTGEVTTYEGVNGNVDSSCPTVKYDSMTFKAEGTANNLVYTDFPASGCDSKDTSFSYTKDGNSLSLNMGGSTPLTAEIMSVSSTLLKLKISVNNGYYQLVLVKA